MKSPLSPILTLSRGPPTSPSQLLQRHRPVQGHRDDAAAGHSVALPAGGDEKHLEIVITSDEKWLIVINSG